MHVLNETEWYLEPLDAEDLIAGLFLLCFAVVFLPLYAVVSYIMFKHSKDITGFRFLFSASLADMLLLINYSLWPGILILCKSEIIAIWMRHWLQMYLDWAWFSMCYHYMIIAWSRFAAIKFPNYFRLQPKLASYSICAACYIVALIQVLSTHFQPWYVTFYYEPSHYGMLSEDFHKYLSEGQSLFFFTFHLLMMIIPVFFYSWAIVLMIKHKKGGLLQRIPSLKSGAPQGQSNVEARLIIPCIFNSIVFIIGQVFITTGTGEGKWATWTVMLLFSANSAVNPLLLIVFSAIIRENLLRIFRLSPSKAKKYGAMPLNLSSKTPTPQFNREPTSLSPAQHSSQLLLSQNSESTQDIML
uniref:G-protein coupled receptors family 1 profile domain-containing protein n=1 Tax=Acrobeloides nanus TaxID=290746 RepID=A0A914C0X4_9BILA